MDRWTSVVPPAPADLRFSASEDGVTWSMPQDLPRNGEDRTSNFQSLAVDSQGRLAIVASHGEARGEQSCGGPKLFRRAGTTTDWTVCSPDGGAIYGFAGRYAQAAFTAQDKLVLAFQHTDTSAGGQPAGIVIWREP